MSSTTSTIFPLEPPLPSPLKTYQETYATIPDSTSSNLSARPRQPRHSKAQLARLHSRNPSPSPQNTPSTSSLPSTPPSPAHHPSLTSTPLPQSAYNYQSFRPPTPPPLHPWPRKKLYAQIVNTAPPVFLSCNLANPVHLASVLAHESGWDIVEQLAEGMTAAVLEEGEYVRDDSRSEGAKGSVTEGVLVGGLVREAMERLEAVFARRGCVRDVVEVQITVRDGGTVVVPAYMYWWMQT